MKITVRDFEQARKVADVRIEGMTATGVAMLQEQERAARTMACKQCGAPMTLVKNSSGHYRDEYGCMNCGESYRPDDYAPVTAYEVERAQERIARFEGYERPIIIQEMYRLLFMAKRALVAHQREPTYAQGFDEGYQAGYEAGRQTVLITIEHRNSADEEFQTAVREEIKRSRVKFPAPDANHAALIEEVGEVAKALMYEPWDNVVKECVQVATMALRLAVEGDATMREFRTLKVHAGSGATMTRYMRPEHMMPGHGFITCQNCGILLPFGYPPDGQGGCDSCKGKKPSIMDGAYQCQFADGCNEQIAANICGTYCPMHHDQVCTDLTLDPGQ